MAEIPPEATKFKPANREKIRRAIARVAEDAVRPSTKLISVDKVMDAGASDRNGATKLLRLWRDGALSVADAWDDPPARPASSSGDSPGEDSPREQLAKKIREAVTDGDREAVVQELAALVAAGTIPPDEAAQIKGALAEARLAADAKRSNEPPPEDPRTLLLASPEAMQAARAIDWLVDDARRDRVLALVAAELEADRAQHPNADEGGA